MNASLKRCWLIAACLLSAISLTACETTKGAGEDIEDAGEEMEDVFD